MRRPIIFVLLAGIAALVAALVVYSALKKREAQIEEAMVKSVNVVVAAKDLLDRIQTRSEPHSSWCAGRRMICRRALSPILVR